ncbi:sugar phosphate isomerase/epimerase [Candidatus Poribacteria bacterium]|nr:sugar phosphate isomerase/epimerase [Candidatus Poribacteria bacterium]
MNISFSIGVGGDAWSLAECAAWAKANDFDAIRPYTTGLFEPNQIIQSGGEEVKEILADTDIYLAALTAHANLLDDDTEKRENARDMLMHAIEAAHILEIPVVVTYAGSPVSWHFYGQFSSEPGNPGDRSAELVERFKEMWSPVVGFAEEKGVRLALDCAVRMGNIACNPEMWERILDAVPSNALGLSCDPSHWLWMGILPAEDAIRMFSGKWYYADVKDCEISPRMLFRQGIIGNWWWQYRVPGRGQLNWGTIIGALLESGYDYVLCVENEDRGAPGLEGFAIGCRHLRQFLSNS